VWILQKHNYENGWVVKLPFTTNRFGFTSCSTEERVCGAVRVAEKKARLSNIQYGLLQPRLINRREFKVMIN
jgi:hypothetical protein